MVVKKLLEEEWLEIDKAYKDLEEQRVKIKIDKNKLRNINAELKSIVEIKEKLVEMEDKKNEYIRTSTNKNDIEYVKAKELEYCINFINNWLLNA